MSRYRNDATPGLLTFGDSIEKKSGGNTHLVDCVITAFLTTLQTMQLIAFL